MGDSQAIFVSVQFWWPTDLKENVMPVNGTHLVLENYIGGEFLPCSAYIDSHDPSTGEVYCKVPDSGGEEVRILQKCPSLQKCLRVTLIAIDLSYLTFSAFIPYVL